jgi:hypothetical protein
MTMRRLTALLPAALLGVGAAVLVSCGGSGAGLIPAQNAGPLLSDFQAVERAALKGSGDCAQTETALSATEHDFQALPASVDAGLHGRLQEGISNLRKRALEMCAQPLAQNTTTGESTSTSTTSTTSSLSTTKTAPPPSSSTTETPTTPSSTTPPGTSTTSTGTTPGATQTSGTEGGTAPGVGAGSEGKAEEGAAGNAQGGSSPSGGTVSGSGGQ